MSNQPAKTDTSDAKQHFISEEKFQQLKQCQKTIFDATEISPSIRRIVNDLINDTNLQHIQSKFIELGRT